MLAALAASATVRNNTTEAIAARWPRDPLRQAAEVPFSSARKWSAVAFAHGDDSLPGIIALGAPTFLRPSLATDDDGEPAGWAALDAAATPWTERGLRVLLVATFADAGALPPHDDEAEATLPAGMRALGLVALADELRAEAGAVLAAFAAARASPSRSSRATTPTRSWRSPARPASPTPPRSRVTTSTTSTRRPWARSPRTRRSSAGSRRPRRSAWSARSRRAATTWR